METRTLPLQQFRRPLRHKSEPLKTTTRYYFMRTTDMVIHMISAEKETWSNGEKRQPCFTRTTRWIWRDGFLNGHWDWDRERGQKYELNYLRDQDLDPDKQYREILRGRWKMGRINCWFPAKSGQGCIEKEWGLLILPLHLASRTFSITRDLNWISRIIYSIAFQWNAILIWNILVKGSYDCICKYQKDIAY